MSYFILQVQHIGWVYTRNTVCCHRIASISSYSIRPFQSQSPYPPPSHFRTGRIAPSVFCVSCRPYDRRVHMSSCQIISWLLTAELADQKALFSYSCVTLVHWFYSSVFAYQQLEVADHLQGWFRSLKLPSIPKCFSTILHSRRRVESFSCLSFISWITVIRHCLTQNYSHPMEFFAFVSLLLPFVRLSSHEVLQLECLQSNPHSCR